MPYVLKTTTSAGELKDAFDQDFDTDRPLDHIHGAILALSNDGFADRRRRPGMVNLVINLSTLRANFSNVYAFIRDSLQDGVIKFRPDTPIHANDENRYQGGKLKDRPDLRARHFEFGAVAGGMRVVFDNDIEEIYVSAHYSFPGKLIANPYTDESNWLDTTKGRLNCNCLIMIDHSDGTTAKQRAEVERLRESIAKADALKLHSTAQDARKKADLLEKSLVNRAQSNRAFAEWMRDPQSFMTAEMIRDLYGPQ